MRFTDQFLKTLKSPNDKPFQDYTDNGLLVRISQFGVKSFYYQYRIHKKRRMLTIGRYPDISLKQARDAIIQAKADLRQGKDPQHQRDEIKKALNLVDTLTVAQALDKFINMHAKHNCGVKTWKQYKSGYDKLPKKILNAHIQDLNTLTISDYISTLHDTPTKAINLLGSLKTAFAWLHNKGYIEQDILKDIKRPFKKTKRKRVLTNEELKTIVQASQAMGYPYGDCTLVLAYTGQRKSEVSDMQWNELDLENGIWTIPSDRAKNSEEHKVPLCPTVLAIINSIPIKEGEYVFSTTAGEKPISHGSKIKARFDKAVNFTDWTIHDIRRTTATNLAKQGVSDSTISTVLNHSKERIQGVTSVYNRHDYLDECKIALQNYGNWLNKLVSDDDKNNVVPLVK